MKKLLLVLIILTMTVSNLYINTFAVETNATEDVTKSNRVKDAESIEAAIKEQNKKKNANEKNAQDEKKDTEKKETNETETKTDPNLPDVLSESAILVNGNTGTILYEKNAHKRMYPASTTKIMTAYIAINKLDLNAALTASTTAVDIARDSSNMGLIAGETFPVKHLLYSLMVQSANDAANVLAEAISGSIPEFVKLMNETAKNLGMTNTNYMNPHGYHDPNHYTTAYDMALVAKKAMENPVFQEIVSTTSLTLAPTDKYKEYRRFSTRNLLISKSADLRYQYPYATGIKTGYTSDAGQCLVGSSDKNGMTLISVVFKAPQNIANAVFSDTRTLFDYAYNNYRLRTVLKADDFASVCKVRWAMGKSHLVLKASEDVKALLPRNNYVSDLLTSEITVYDNIVAPVKEGDTLGQVKYFYDGKEIAVSDLVATRSISRSIIKQVMTYVLSAWFILIFGIIVAIIIIKRVKRTRKIARTRKIQKGMRR